MTDNTPVLIRVIVRDVTSGRIIHNKVGDHEDPEFRKWMGRTSFWAMRNGHSVFSSSYNVGVKPGAHDGGGRYTAVTRAEFDHVIRQSGTGLIIAYCANPNTAAKAAAALNACAIIPRLDNLEG